MKFRDERQTLRLNTEEIIDLKKYEEKELSYGELCNIFNVPKFEGTQKKSQIKQFQEYFVLQKKNKKYYISEVYDPKTRIIMSGSQFRSKGQIEFDSYIAEELLNDCPCYLKPHYLTNTELLKTAHYIDDYNIDLPYDKYKKLINKARRHLNYLIDKGIVCWFIGYCLYVKNSNKVKYVHYYDPEFDYINFLYGLTIPSGYKRKDIFELPYCTDVSKIDNSILNNVACPYYKIKRVNIIQALIDDLNLQRFIL